VALAVRLRRRGDLDARVEAEIEADVRVEIVRTGMPSVLVQIAGRLWPER